MGSIPVTFWIWNGFRMGIGILEWALTYSTLMHPSIFHRSMLLAGIPLIIQVSTVLSPECIARSLVTTHKSVKTQTQRLLQLFKASITVRKAAGNSTHWADLFFPSLVKTTAFQTGWCPFTWELPSMSQVVFCHSVESCLSSSLESSSFLHSFRGHYSRKDSPCLRVSPPCAPQVA